MITPRSFKPYQEVPSECEATDYNKEDAQKEPCSFCVQVPCDWEAFGDLIFDEGMELKESGLENNQVRYHAYCHYTRLKHGVLRRHDRRSSPACVRGEIMENWPDPNRKYVGFQAALKDAAKE
jgi:hypothetical protein